MINLFYKLFFWRKCFVCKNILKKRYDELQITIENKKYKHYLCEECRFEDYDFLNDFGFIHDKK